MSSEQEALVPAYIPWETFTGFIAHLKATAVPGRIDKSMMPSEMPRLTRGQILSALKFLNLVDGAGTTSSSLRKLVAAYETEEWAEEVGTSVCDAFDEIIRGLDLSEATQAQLDERFKAAGVQGQMLSKSIRFYLSAVRAAGWAFSPHLLAKRKSAGSGKRKATTRSKSGNGAAHSDDGDGKARHATIRAPEGTKSYPLYFKGKPDGAIIVPADLGPGDCKVIELQLAVLRAYAGVDT